MEKKIKKQGKVEIDLKKLYNTDESEEFKHLKKILEQSNSELMNKVVWTASTKRLFTLVGRCLRHKVRDYLIAFTWFISS